jgi:SsrA-binding protein|tara:strand:+ start:503 stop:982 length:480 start_codon:yes stop_codon:yes gene_type:complete
VSKRKQDTTRPPSVNNAKARHKYFIGDKFEAGISLRGTEVKSLRAGRAQISESFGRFVKDELFLFNAHIAEYEFGGSENHEPLRLRKLLLHKRELLRLKVEVEAGGKSIIPLRIYFKGSLVKLEIGVCTGKKLHDKREDLKKRSADRETEQALKHYNRR